MLGKNSNAPHLRLTLLSLTPAVTGAFVVSAANEKHVRVYGLVSHDRYQSAPQVLSFLTKIQTNRSRQESSMEPRVHVETCGHVCAIRLLARNSCIFQEDNSGQFAGNCISCNARLDLPKQLGTEKSRSVVTCKESRAHRAKEPLG